MSDRMVSQPIDQSLTMPVRKSLNVNNLTTILEYCAKPRIIQQRTWTPAQAAGVSILSAPIASFPSYFAGAQPAFLDKLTGFTGIRYTTNIKIVMNANPFQAGKLRFIYYPNGGPTRGKYDAHVATRMSLSQMPGAELTTMEKCLEISIPFLSYQEYREMTATPIDPLLMDLHVFSPLVNGPNATRPNVSVTMWMWLTDVELFGTSTVQPQSKMTGKKRIGRHVASEEERPLSSWLGATSRLATSMSSVPIISGIAGPTAVWTKYAAGVANAFGYSRPVQGEPTRAVAPHYHNSITNADGLNVGSTLALNKDASARVISDYSPSGLDEMSVNFIKKQWAFVTEFAVPVTAASGTQVFTSLLGLNVGGSAPTNFGTSITPLEFLGRMFRYYRGGIEICFKFVKTGFHAGSLVFSYNVGPSTTPITLADADRLHRTVVDLQDGDSVCLSFPFISPNDWLTTNAFYGRMFVHVLNELVAPETVAQAINVQCYFRGMDDLEYSGWNHQDTTLPQLATPIVSQGGIEMQGMGTEANDEIVCEPIGGSLVEPPMTGLQMMDSMSESVTSILQFLKCGVPLFLPVLGSLGDQVAFSFNPSTWAVRTRTSGGTLGAPPIGAVSFSTLRSCYAYQRGGYELNILPSLQNTDNTEAVQISSDYFFGSVSVYENNPPSEPDSLNYRQLPLIPNTLSNFGPRAVNHSRFGLTATLPYKSLFRVNLIRAIGTITETYGDDQFRARFTVKCNSRHTLKLRPAEDFQLLYWVGVPPMFLA